MSYTVAQAAAVLFSTIGKNASDTGLPAGMLSTVTGCINAAMEEVRTINPAIFSVPMEALLNGPSAGTLTLDSDLLNFTAGTLVVPNAGCTVLLDGTTYHNQIGVQNSSKWTLVRKAEVPQGAASGTVWHDAWAPADGTTYERIIGDVWWNHRYPIAVLADHSELVNVRPRADFGQVALGYTSPYPAAQVQACWLDNSAPDPLNPPVGRIRFWPMPAGPQLISLTVVRRFADFTDADVTSGSKTIGMPGGKEALIFEPILMKKWLARPFFKPDAVQAAAVREDYQRAVERLEVYRPFLGVQGMRTR